MCRLAPAFAVSTLFQVPSKNAFEPKLAQAPAAEAPSSTAVRLLICSPLLGALVPMPTLPPV